MTEEKCGTTGQEDRKKIPVFLGGGENLDTQGPKSIGIKMMGFSLLSLSDIFSANMRDVSFPARQISLGKREVIGG